MHQQPKSTYNTAKLFQQFKQYLHKQNKIKKCSTPIGDGYKQLIDQLKRSNQNKRQKKTRCAHLYTSISKQPIVQTFVEPIQTTVKQLSASKENTKFKLIRNYSANNINSRLISTQHLKKQKSQTKINLIKQRRDISSTKLDKLEKIQQQILMIQCEKMKLSQQISSLRSSLNKLTKQVQITKKGVQIQKRNQQKYQHISYLANSILHQTQNIKFKNNKGLYNMVNKHEQTISSLKRFKSTIRKEKEQSEANYIQQINAWNESQKSSKQNKQREFLFQKKNKSVSKSIKLKIHFIQEIDLLVQLLRQKQTEFSQIVEEECSRVRLVKFNKSLLSKQKVNILNKIQSFQDKYNIKMESVEKLVFKVFKNISVQNCQLEERCLNLSRIKEEAGKEYSSVKSKYDYETQRAECEVQLQNSGYSHALRKIQKNSEMFIQILNVFQMILLKFRFMFSLALTLDVDKKQFRDAIAQIDKFFNEGLFFTFNIQRQLLTAVQKHDILNQIEFAQILNLIFPQITYIQSRDLSHLLFKDKTTSLIVHKSWLLQKMYSLKARHADNIQIEVANLIDQIKMNCCQIYNKKLQGIFHLFMTCINSVSMSKYQMRLAVSSTSKNSLFFPSNKNSKILQVTNRQDYFQDDDCKVGEKTIKQIIFKQEEEKPKLIQKDPLKMISSLQKLKNRAKLKQINFISKGKQYKFNESIIIPNFTLQVFD